MSDSSYGSARLLTRPDDSALLLKLLPREIPYRGSSATQHPRGTARTPQAAILQSLADLKAPARLRMVRLELEDCPWAPIPAWRSMQRWVGEVATAYARLYSIKVAPEMPGNPISLKTLTAVARARAAYADFATGRNCRPTVKRLMADTGLGERTIQRATKALVLLGLATEVFRGRLRTLTERMASWRVGDRGRGWASMYALHPCRFHHLVAPHLRSGQVFVFNSRSRQITTEPRRNSGTAKAAPRRPDRNGGALARQWLSSPETPSWARRYRTSHAWASNLRKAAEHHWTARDINQLIRDYRGAGHWVPDAPHRPAGLLGAMLRWYGDLSTRPTAACDAREAQELAAIRADHTARTHEHHRHLIAREAARAALGGAGHREALRLARAATIKATERKTQEARRVAEQIEAAIRKARGL